MPAVVTHIMLGGWKRLFQSRDHALCRPSDTAEFCFHITETNPLS
ncbi:hypothetical protein SFOMI_0969 [Sphingobium fuliginis]|uniref:Uncharacterized protein n=1 Tax=Sphingobium fuliginis (strain ATCC 27551) TaxID=336203 RepID=A0A292ZCD6_SPHSA|nr:hypothetical protein SFOMI_0969 [Sphingobium fuliginis]